MINIVLIIIIIVLLYLWNNVTEPFALTTQETNEAIQNISSVYNNQNMTIDNLNMTGNLSTTGTSTLTGLVTANNGVNITGPLSVNGSSTIPTVTGNQSISGNLTVGGTINTTFTNCQWIDNGYPGVGGSYWPGTTPQCLTTANNGVILTDPLAADWNQMTCPAGFVQTGFRLGHVCGADNTYDLIPQIQCCQL